MRDKLSRLSVYVRDVRDVRDVFLFHNIYIFTAENHDEIGVFCEGRAEGG